MIITMEYDTKDKSSCVVRIDGQKIEDLYKLEICQYDDEASVTLETAKYDEDNTVSQRSVLYATEKESLNELFSKSITLKPER